MTGAYFCKTEKTKESWIKEDFLLKKSPNCWITTPQFPNTSICIGESCSLFFLWGEKSKTKKIKTTKKAKKPKAKQTKYPTKPAQPPNKSPKALVFQMSKTTYFHSSCNFCGRFCCPLKKYLPKTEILLISEF